MRVRGPAARQQRGQAMLEYALISATVVLSFALASQVGVTRSVADRMSESQDAWNIRLWPLGPGDSEKISPSTIHARAQGFNDQIKLR